MGEIQILVTLERSWLIMDKVAAVLEVTRTDDTQEVVLIHPDLKPDASGVGRLVFSPRHARYLANLLIEHAAVAEAEAAVSALGHTGSVTAVPAREGEHSHRDKRND